MCWFFRRRRLEKKRVEDVAGKLVSRLRASHDESKAHHALKKVSFREDDLFINQCKVADVPPENMIYYLRGQLTNPHLCLTERVTTEKLLDLLCAQLRTERIQTVAEDYQFHTQTFARLEASCAEWGLKTSDIVAFFNPCTGDRVVVARMAQLREAVRGGRDCPLF